MKVALTVPKMGESITEVRIGKTLKAHGEAVQRDEELLEIETDKVNQVLYAPQSGVVKYVVKEGDTVKVGAVIGSIEGEAMPQAQPEKIAKPAPAPQATARVSREAWLHEEKVAAPAEKVVLPVQEAAAPTPERAVIRKPLSHIRKVIAQRLVEVQNESAMLTTFNEVDMSAIVGIRERYREPFVQKHGVKLGFMPFFVTAVVRALETFPAVNSYIEGDDLVMRTFFDIGVAVSTERGLLVPVLRDANQMTLVDIEKKIADFSTRARGGAILVEELQGGSFTITNGGVFGSLLSTPILNPGQAAILGMHKIEKRAVVIDDAIGIRPMMYLALSYDHRILDGKEAVSFLVLIKNELEDPTRFILDL